MATFEYRKKDGSAGTITAADGAAALTLLPQDADPRSGIIAVGGGTAAPSPSNPNPTAAGAGTPNKLADFATSLDAAVNLARKGRNKSSLDLMKPYRGTVAASDFNSILGNLNAASDRTSSDLIKRATEAEKAPDYKLVQNDNGDVTALDPTTGEVAWVRKGVGNKQGSSGGGAGTSLGGGVIQSGDLVISTADILEGQNRLKASALEGPEADGTYVDPNQYLAAYKLWVVKNKGKSSDFFKYYPLSWVNPANTAVLEQITKANVGGGSGRSI